MRLAELCRAADIFCPVGSEDVEISSVTSNSEKVKKGSLFVCLTGTHTDGNMFAERARAMGAAAVLSDKRRESDLFCEDACAAHARLCRKLYGEGIEKLRLVGVTGTNGKTTVTALVRSILRAAGEACGSIGTLVSVDGEGKAVAMLDITEEVMDISAAGNGLAVLYSGTMVVYDRSLQEVATVEDTGYANRVLMQDDGSVLVIGGNTAWRYVP